MVNVECLLPKCFQKYIENGLFVSLVCTTYNFMWPLCKSFKKKLENQPIRNRVLVAYLKFKKLLQLQRNCLF